MELGATWQHLNKAEYDLRCVSRFDQRSMS